MDLPVSLNIMTNLLINTFPYNCWLGLGTLREVAVYINSKSECL